MNRLVYCVLIAVGSSLTFAALPARADVQVSGKTYAVSDTTTPLGGVTIQAYVNMKSSPIGDPVKSKDAGDYMLSVPAGYQFVVVYAPPEDTKLLPATKPDSGAFDGTDGKSYHEDVSFYTAAEFQKKFGKDALQKHLNRLLKILPRDHPQVKKLKGLLDNL